MKKQQEADQSGREEEREDIITDMPATKTGITTDTTTHPMVFVGDSDPINQFIEWPIIRPDGAYQPIQYPVTGQLLCNGVGHENLKAAALVSTCMLSSMLGYPISAMLAPEDAQGAIHLVDQCLRLIPHEAVIEIPELKPEHLFIDGGKRLDGKCIVSPTENGFNKVERDLELILTRGRTIRQELTRGKFEVGFSEHRSVMRVSILGIDYGRLGKRLNLPSVLKIPVTSNGATELPGKSEVADQYGLNNSPLFKIRKSFQRLKQRTVVIPYEQQLGNAMANNGCDHVSAKLEVMKNLISILAITNQPLPVQMAELGAMIYGTDEKEVGRWLIDTGLIKDLEPMPVKPVVATKVDYYLARLLLNGVLLAGPTRYTDRQRRVFETVKAINMGKMTSTILTKGDEVEVLAAVARSTGCWAKREKVFEEINKARYDFSLSSVNNDLVELLDMGVLERAKPPKDRFFGYYITTMALSNAINLPAPDTIQDPVYEGKKVDVVNPFTGEVDRI